MSKDKKSESDQFFIFLIALLLSAVIINKYGPGFILLLVRHKYWVAAIVTGAVMSLWIMIRNKIVVRWEQHEQKRVLFKRQDEDSTLVGRTKAGQPVFIPLSARRMHSQIVGTTNAGKTESVIIPWAVSDIREGRGLILIDGKSDRSLLEKLYAYCVKYRRAKDFRLLSLVNVPESSTFNPLIGGSPEEVTERVFSAFTFEDEYYRNQQYEVLKHTLILFKLNNVTPTFQRLYQAITEPAILLNLSVGISDEIVKQWAERFVKLPADEREKRSSGIVTQIGHFATGETSALFNDDSPMIDIEQVMREGLIVYCQLPAMKVPVLGKATGKMILQAVQSAVSSRHLEKDKGFKFFGIYLDDFTEYLTPGFVTLLNKSRSGNVGVTFAHQAQGDLAGLGDDVRNSVLTNSNLKVFMRTNEPDTAEYFSRTLGTKQNVKLTERQRTGAFGKERTGEGSVRDVEEFIHHPNLFKRELGTGEAVMVVPLGKGNHAVELKFDMLPDLPATKLPNVTKTTAGRLPKPNEETSEDGKEASCGKATTATTNESQSAPIETIDNALGGVA